MKEKTNQPKKGWRYWCCGIPTVIIVLIIIGGTITIFINEKIQTDRISKRDKPETYSEIFNTNFTPDYTVSDIDEGKFNQKMVNILQKYNSGTIDFSENEKTNLFRLLSSEEAIEFAKSDIKFLKDYYPEGYCLIVNHVLTSSEENQMFPNFYLRSGAEESRIDFLVHELSHIAGFTYTNFVGHSYLIEEKIVTLNGKLDLPQGDELIQYINEPSDMDNTYLKK